MAAKDDNKESVKAPTHPTTAIATQPVAARAVSPAVSPPSPTER